MVENEQSFGEYLRQLIRDSGITQHKFYTELGIRKPYFYDILAGRTNPPPLISFLHRITGKCLLPDLHTARLLTKLTTIMFVR